MENHVFLGFLMFTGSILLRTISHKFISRAFVYLDVLDLTIMI